MILVRLLDEQGLEAWGEILPREYVTGECIDSIMNQDALIESLNIIGARIESFADLTHWLNPLLEQGRDHLALVGGVELALWSLLSQQQNLNLDSLIGPIRTRATAHCFTIGIDCNPDDIRKKFVAARMQKASTIKLKVGLDIERDVECIGLLQTQCAEHIQLRLDGNAALSFEQAEQLLSGLSKKTLHSFEEPLDIHDADHVAKLCCLHARFAVDMMADESICSAQELQRLIANDAYQWINVRVGKHGGLLASCRIRDTALAAGLGVVGGSMVGETVLMTQASTLLLNRSTAMDYVEGLGQYRSWLKINPFAEFEMSMQKVQSVNVNRAEFDACLVSQSSIS